MADVGTGITIAFGTSSFSAQIIGTIENDGIEREAIKVTHHGVTDYHRYIPGKLVELGEITFEFLVDPDVQPPIEAVAEEIVITFPVPAGSSNGATLTFDGFMTAWKWSAPLEEAMTGEGTIMMDGSSYTWADAS